MGLLAVFAHTFSLKNNNFTYLFVFDCAGSLLLHRIFFLSLQRVEAVSSSCSVQASRCCGISCETQAPDAWASVVALPGSRAPAQ